MRRADGPTILVTGGSGLVGSAIVDAMRGVRIYSLTRRGDAPDLAPNGDDPDSAAASAAALLPDRHGHLVTGDEMPDRAVHVRGDVTKPSFGLSDREYAALARRVDLVLHSAGVSDFTTPKRITNALNIEGTRQTIAFAQDAGVPLYHVSTAYVEAEGTTMNDRWGAKIYIDSKREAERLVADSGVLAATIRPSIVFGDSRTGWSPSFQGLHRMIGMMLENKMPLLPFGPETRVDFLPRDTVGRVAADLVLSGYRGEYWLTAGPAALEFGCVVEILLEYGRGLGLELQPPRFVDREMIDRLIRPAGGETMGRRVDLLLALTSHFESQASLPSSVPGDEVPDLEEALLRGAEYWGEHHGVASRRDEVAA